MGSFNVHAGQEKPQGLLPACEKQIIIYKWKAIQEVLHRGVLIS